jgi:hypothetical protein
MLISEDDKNKSIRDIAFPILVAGLSVLFENLAEWVVDELREKYGTKPREHEKKEETLVSTPVMGSVINSLGLLVESTSRGDVHAIQITIPDPSGNRNMQYRTFIRGNTDSALHLFNSIQDRILRGPLFREALESKNLKTMERAVLNSIDLASHTLKVYGMKSIPYTDVSENIIEEMFEDFDRVPQDSKDVHLFGGENLCKLGELGILPDLRPPLDTCNLLEIRCQQVSGLLERLSLELSFLQSPKERGSEPRMGRHESPGFPGLHKFVRRSLGDIPQAIPDEFIIRLEPFTDLGFGLEGIVDRVLLGHCFLYCLMTSNISISFVVGFLR